MNLIILGAVVLIISILALNKRREIVEKKNVETAIAERQQNLLKLETVDFIQTFDRELKNYFHENNVEKIHIIEAFKNELEDRETVSLRKKEILDFNLADNRVKMLDTKILGEVAKYLKSLLKSKRASKRLKGEKMEINRLVKLLENDFNSCPEKFFSEKMFEFQGGRPKGEAITGFEYICIIYTFKVKIRNYADEGKFLVNRLERIGLKERNLKFKIEEEKKNLKQIESFKANNVLYRTLFD